MMTRQHFAVIAAVLLNEKPDTEGKIYSDRTPWAQGAYDEWSTIVLNMAACLKTQNPRFDRARFLAACGME